MILRPCKQRLFKGAIYGFDIETYNKNKNFLCATLYFSDDKYWTFYDPHELINFMKKKRFKDSYVVATNLGFDFFGTFFKKEELKEFNIMFRGSDLLYAKSFIRNKTFKKRAFDTVDGKTKGKKGGRITFIDTMNFSKISVAQIGKILGIPKLKSPSFIGEKPKTKEQLNEMVTYNIRDSKISKMYLEFLFDAFGKLGASHKSTIASTSLSLFRNKYLEKDYFRADIEVLLEHFKAYYGGRTEAFSRGRIRDYNYYDFNSLYPSVMLNEFPDPNSLRMNYKNTNFYIKNFHGISEVTVYCPNMKYPLLPFRKDKKLVFPTGKFKGWYSHIELRKAVEIGYCIMDVHKTYYYKENCHPFKEIITDLYNLRLKFKAEKSPMEYVVKILMNSLYGKFAQKFTDRDGWQPFNHTIGELEKLEFFERFGDFIRFKKKLEEPSYFCFPIWSLYVTAYGRLKLYDEIIRLNPVYVDTDSLITKVKLLPSDKLGELKLEMPIKEGIIVKPKFYAFVSDDDKEYVKIKGVGKRLLYDEFLKFIYSPKITYDKFMKFKESIRRGFIPNEIVSIVKELSLEDDKRVWDGVFNPTILQNSRSVNIENENKTELFDENKNRAFNNVSANQEI